MRAIEMKKLRKLKISFEENQDVFLKDFSKLEKKLNSNSNIIFEKRFLIVELALARHASSYGLLGVTFLPSKNDNENTLLLEVRFNNDKIPFHESISNDKGYAFLGLEKSYAESILSSALQFFSNHNIPSGELIFDTGAYCDIGSSVKIFSCITKILLSILLDEHYNISDEQLEYICETQLEKEFAN